MATVADKTFFPLNKPNRRTGVFRLAFLTAIFLVSGTTIFLAGVKNAYAETVIEGSFGITNSGGNGLMSGFDSLPQNTFMLPANGAYDLKLYKNTYPVATDLKSSGSGSSWTWSGFNGTNYLSAWGDGDFYVKISQASTSKAVVFCANKSGSTYATTSCGIAPLPTETSFVSVSPASGATVASTTVTFTANIYLSSTDAGAYVDQVCFEDSNVDISLQYSPAEVRRCMDITASGASTVSTTTLMSRGVHNITWYFYGADTGANGSPFIYKAFNTEYTVLGAVYAQEDEFFASTTASYDTFNSDCTSASGITEKGICLAKNMISSVLAFFFVPSQSSTEKFMSLNDTLQTKTPFVYIYQMNDMREDLFTNTGTSTMSVSVNIKWLPSMGTSTITFISPTMISAVPYSSTVKTILGWLMWLITIETIYILARRAFNKEQQ